MGNSEEGTDCSSEETSSHLPEQEQQQNNPVYPNYVVMQGYFSAGMQVQPYFSPAVAPGGHAPPPYMWGPPMQHMIPPYAGMYPHGSVYAHPGVTVAANPTHVHNGGETEGSSEGSDGNTSCLNGQKRSRGGSSSSSKVVKTDESDANGDSKKVTSVTILGKSVGTVISGDSGNELEVKESHAAADMIMAPTPITVQVHSNERELKREKRKQSNRESARRSRLRKQAEAEELGTKVESLTNENLSLKSEINRLTVHSANLELQNAKLLEKLKKAQVEEATKEDPRPDKKGSSLSTVNLLSKVENGSGSVVEGPASSGAALRQLLDASPMADAVAVG